MHANYQELLSLRDGTPVGAEISQHVSDCERCHQHLAALEHITRGLRKLPQLAPSPQTWGLIREELHLQRGLRASSRWPFAAAASVLAAGVALLAIWAAHQHWTVSTTSALTSASAAMGRDSIGPLVARSQELEQILRNLPQRPTVERAATAATIDELQTRIQELDYQLSNAMPSERERDQDQRLWSARVHLLSSLVYLRYAEAAQNGYRPARPSNSGVI
jgi:hypothetical protein